MVRGVRWRLVLFSGGATLMVLLLLGVAIYTAVSNSLTDQGVAQLEARATTLTSFIENPRRGDPPIDVLVGGRTSGTFAYLVDPDGESYRPRSVPDIDGLPDPQAIDAARGGKRDLRNVTAGASDPFRVMTEPVTTRNGERWLIQIVQDRTAEVNTLDALLRVLSVAASWHSCSRACWARRMPPARWCPSGRRCMRSEKRCGASASSPPTRATSCARH